MNTYDSVNQAREFLSRYHQLSENSGYQLVYDTLALLQETVPCPQIIFMIVSPKTLELDNIEPATVPLYVATPFVGMIQPVFVTLYKQIDYATQFLKFMLSHQMAGKKVPPYSFSDHEWHNKGLVHYFYSKIKKSSDVLVTSAVLANQQFIASAHTNNYYSIVACFAREGGNTFNDQEKSLLALCFDIFVEDLKKKIAAP